MRLSTALDRDEELALATIAAAVDAGITVFDTAHAYGHGEAELGHNERLLARALRACDADRTARIVTKGGMRRPDGGWRPDGRAGTIRRHCEAGLEALDPLPIDTYLLHAPDPRTPWATSVRALARLVDAGLVARVGLSNVTVDQLDQALDLAPVSVVQVAMSVLEDTPVRGGLLDRCADLGLGVIAHSPLGGPRRLRRTLTDPVLAEVAAGHEDSETTPAEVALAWLLSRWPTLVAIPGARRPQTARSAARAARLALSGPARDRLDGAFDPRAARRAAAPGALRRAAPPAEVVMVMGIPGSGKTRLARRLAADGALRLNRDERGGTLRDVAADLDDALGTRSGARRVVLDNTYLTRVARSHVLDVAARHGAAVRCRWLDTPLAQAQVNLVTRLLEVFGHLPMPDELAEAARGTAGLLTPTAQLRAARQLEVPSVAEGFVAVEQIPFVREEPVGEPVVVLAAAAMQRPGWQQAVASAHPDRPHLLLDWRPDEATPPGVRPLADLAAAVGAVAHPPVDTAVCDHPGGPPRCWCRPPLPGLALAFARRHGARVAVVIGVGPAHRNLASALGADFLGL